MGYLQNVREMCDDYFIMLFVVAPQLGRWRGYDDDSAEHLVRCHHCRRHRTLSRGVQALRGEAAFPIQGSFALSRSGHEGEVSSGQILKKFYLFQTVHFR